LYSGDLLGAFCAWEFGELGTTIFDTHGRLNHHLLYESSDHRDALWSIAAHENVDYCVTASADGTILLYDCATYESNAITPRHPPLLVAFLSDGGLFVVACKDGYLYSFNRETRAEVTEFQCGSPIVTMAAGLSETQVIAALEDGNVRIVDIENSTVLKEFKPHGAATSALAVLSDGPFYVTTSSDREVRIWKAETLDVSFSESYHKEKYGEAGLCLAVTPREHPTRVFAAGGADGVVRVFGK
jgi:WD40 repeat protein